MRGAIDEIAYQLSFHLVARVWRKQRRKLPRILDRRIEPGRAAGRGEDDGHSVVHWANQFVRGGRQDREVSSVE